MSAPSEGSPVADEAVLLRLPKPPLDYVPDHFRPSHLHFRPTDEDEAEAAARDGAVRLSVWDASRTTAVQAARFRGAVILVLRLRADKARQAGTARSMPVDVVYDPLPAAQRESPGAAGHAGIEGLHRPDSAPKKAYTELRQALADACEPQIDLVDPE